MSRSTQLLSKGRWGTKTTLIFLALATAAALAALSAFAVSVSVDAPAAKAQTTSTPTWELQTTEGNLPDGKFKSVVGLSQGKFEVIEHRDSQDRDIKIPGRKNVSNIVLSRPLKSASDLSDWHQMVNGQDPTAGHTDGSLARLDGTGRPIAVFNFFNAWPADYRVVQNGSQISEEIELVVDSVERDAGPS